MRTSNIKSLQKIIGPSESTIEWKPSLSQMKDVIESVTAFANTEGGKLPNRNLRKPEGVLL